MSGRDALYDGMSHKVFRNMFFCLAVLLTVARWANLVQETGDYAKQLYYCKDRMMYCFEIIRFGVFLTYSPTVNDEK
jgi:hypothetical protein